MPVDVSKNRVGPPPGTTRTIRLEIQYDGAAYVGWQRQAKGESIQGTLEKVLAKVASEKVTLHGSSRTDAGVHARQQVASFSLKKSKTPTKAFVQGTNSLLPEDIRVVSAFEMPVDYLAHAAVKEKTYRYFLCNGREPSVFSRGYAWHVYQPLDVEAMRKGAGHLVGTRDFASFRSALSDTKTTVRTIKRADFIDAEFGLLCFEITADGFLKHMVRAIVGTLVEIGLGKRKPHEMKEILDAKSRIHAGQAAPPQGLFLWSVFG